MLARREHGEQELLVKLVAKGCEQEIAAAVIAELKGKDLVSDRRFVEVLVGNRMRRGHGPLRIRHELQQRGIGQALIEDTVDANDPMWLAQLREVWVKKFGGGAPDNYREWARQARFLQGRGYSAEQIKQIVPQVR